MWKQSPRHDGLSFSGAPVPAFLHAILYRAVRRAMATTSTIAYADAQPLPFTKLPREYEA
jgi:hypothetical protein